MKTTSKVSVRSFATAINHDITPGNIPMPDEMLMKLEDAQIVPEKTEIARYAMESYAVTIGRLPKPTSNWSRTSFAGVDPMRSIARPMTTRERLQLSALRTPASPKGIVAKLVAAQAETSTESDIPRMIANGHIEIQPGMWVPLRTRTVYPESPIQSEERIQRPWALDVDELKSSIYSTLNDLHGLEAWKKEQAKVRQAQSSTFRINTEKVTRPDGKREWDNAIVRQFPPLTVVRANDGTVLPSEGVIHVPARYVVQLPGGKMVDLGKTQGKWKPVLHNAPDAALRAVATRLGMSIKGGAASIVAAIWNKTDIVPSYQTIWKDAPWLDTVDANGLVTNNGWLVIVGYERNRTIALSHYLANEDGDLIHATEELELTPVQIKNFTERLTVSKSEYRILSRANIATADGEGIMDDEGNINVDEYMELDAEMIDQGFQRDGERFEVDTDQITGGMLLVEEAALLMQPKNFEHLPSYGLTDMLNDFRAGVPIWECDGFRDALAELARGVRRENAELTGKIAALKTPISIAMMKVFHSLEGSFERQDALDALKDLQKRKNALLARQWGYERIRNLNATDDEGAPLVGGRLEVHRFNRLYRQWFEDRADLDAQTLLPRNYGHWAGRFDRNGNPVLENPVKITPPAQKGFETVRPRQIAGKLWTIPSPSRHEQDYGTFAELDPANNAPLHPQTSHKAVVAQHVAPGRVVELFEVLGAKTTPKRPTRLTATQKEEHAEHMARKHARRVIRLHQQVARLESIKNHNIQMKDWNRCLANQSAPKDNATTGPKWTLNSDQAMRFW